MGYRSDVAYAIAFPSLKDMREFVAVQRLRDDWINDALQQCQYEPALEAPIMSFEAEYVKWDTTYASVKAHLALLKAAREMDYVVAFVEIGEDELDNSEDFHEGDADLYPGNYVYPYDLVGLRRSIYVHFPQSDTPATATEILEGEHDGKD